MHKFTNLVREEMERKNISTADIARATKKTWRHIKFLLDGERQWTFKMADAVADFVGISINYRPLKRRRKAAGGETDHS